MSLAAYGGVPLVSFAVALTGALLAAAALALHRAWRTVRTTPGERAACACGRGRGHRVVAVLAVPLVGGAGLAAAGRVLADRRAARRRPSRSSRATCRGPASTSTPSAAPSSTTTCSETLELAADVGRRRPSRSPTSCIWPENSSDIDPFLNDDAARADRPRRTGDRRADPGRRRRRRARAVHQQHRDRVGPGDGPGGHLRQAAPGAARRVRARPAASSGSSATRSTWSGATSARRRRGRACSTSAAHGWATSSASRSSTTAWWATWSTAAPG